MVALLSAGLAACGSVTTQLGHRSNDLKHLQIVTTPAANQNSATPIDVVWVFNPATLAGLPKSSPQWFATQRELQKGLASGIAVLSWELPPEMVVHTSSLPSGHEKAVAVLVYVNSISPEPPLHLGKDHCSRITVQATRVAYAPC